MMPPLWFLFLNLVRISDEMENQLAFRLAKEADPEGKRTVGKRPPYFLSHC